MDLVEQLEGVLFYRAAPMKIPALATFFEVSEEQLKETFSALGEKLRGRGIELVVTDTEAVLVTARALAPTIEKLRKDDLKRDIGKAGAETLAIIAYRGPLSRIEIDRIRGVNSTFILRNLLIRGLVERRDNPKDQRSFLYAATPALYTHLGVTKREELPDFKTIMDNLDSYEAEQKESDSDAKENDSDFITQTS